MTLSVSRFDEWKARSREERDAKEWLAHIGRVGRKSTLKLSPAHCKAPDFSVAGQYDTGGQNYWESPKAFNSAIMAVIIERFSELSAEATQRMEVVSAQALIDAESQIADIHAAIQEAKAVTQRPTP